MSKLFKDLKAGDVAYGISDDTNEVVIATYKGMMECENSCDRYVFDINGKDYINCSSEEDSRIEGIEDDWYSDFYCKETNEFIRLYNELYDLRMSIMSEIEWHDKCLKVFNQQLGKLDELESNKVG